MLQKFDTILHNKRSQLFIWDRKNLMLHTILYIKTTSSTDFRSNGSNHTITIGNYAP
jgi:hypothetical protein